MKLIQKPFVFVRHAQSTFNALGLIGGATDSPLSDEGIRQAKAAEPLLRRHWNAVITSGLTRTAETASYIIPGIETVPYPELNERHWGDLEGLPTDHQVPYDATPPGGESWEAFERRIVTGLNAVLSSYERPLIIAHSGVYRVLNNIIHGTPFCPRVANVTPIQFTPADNDCGWIIAPLEELSDE